MNSTVTRLLLLGLFVLAASSSRIGAQSMIDTVRVTPVRASLVFLSLGEDIQGLSLRLPDGLKAVEVPSAMRSRPISYEGPAVIEFVRVPEGAGAPSAEALAVLPIVASVQLPPEGGRRLLLFLRNPNAVPGAPEFGVMAVADDAATLPAGHYRVINGVPDPLVVALGEARVALDAGRQVVVDPAVPQGGYAELRVMRSVGDTWEMAFSSRQLHSSRLRYLVFLSPSASGDGRLDVKVVPDLPASP